MVLEWMAHNAIGLLLILTPAHGQIPQELRPWLEMPQTWERDTEGPILSLGKSGEFDDTHMFAPAVEVHDGRYSLWYSGSTGAVSNRVFQLGLATSRDGREFTKHDSNPVFKFGDGKHSILTPSVMREDGGLRMWFVSTWFAGGNGLHTLHESFSEDGVTWSRPSPALLKNVYAPTVFKTGQHYRMWYVDVGKETWIIRHASSTDGRKWRVTPEPCLVIDQKWEQSRLFYPHVKKIDDVYVMWYGSYWSERPNTTALGFAASIDGLKWYKFPQNPVLRPDPSRPWESHYVTSQAVARNSDGSLRMWFASRKKPPFQNKYFAINTAIWNRQAIQADRADTSDGSPLQAEGDRDRIIGIPCIPAGQKIPGTAAYQVELAATSGKPETNWLLNKSKRYFDLSEVYRRAPLFVYRQIYDLCPAILPFQLLNLNHSSPQDSPSHGAGLVPGRQMSADV